MENEKHIPVMLDEAVSLLVTKSSGIYFDGTLGFGGHSEEIVKRLDDNGKLIAADVDEDAFSFSQKKFESDDRVKLFKFNFSRIDIISKIESVEFFDGVIADLGVSSFQLDNPESGFTYREEADLDLRMDKTTKLNAADVVNSFSEEDLADILYRFGEEKNSRLIARRIVQQRFRRKIRTTRDLAAVIEEVTPPPYRNKSLSRVFQALRIYVNDELEMLKIFLTKSVDLLSPGGRIVILSYHSLEDRIVKDAFRYEALDCICPKDFPICTCGKESRLKIITKRPMTATKVETDRNHRARSVKLRAAERK
jgi:16S rRNA (cytosine1402-N4)-methyltransferase